MPFTKIDTATAGNTTIVAALAGKCNRVVGGFLTANTTTTVTFYDGATSLTGAMTLIAGTPFQLAPAPASPGGGRFAYMQGTVNTALVLNLGANAQLSGVIEYDFVGG